MSVIGRPRSPARTWKISDRGGVKFLMRSSLSRNSVAIYVLSRRFLMSLFASANISFLACNSPFIVLSSSFID